MMPKQHGHGRLFDELPFDWESEWWGMPEYLSADNTPFQKIVISFRNEQEVRIFARLINRRITNKTNSIWFSEKPKDDGAAPKDFLWVTKE